MIPYFQNDNNWDAYRNELMDWIGTPYRHMTNIKKRGADCALFIGNAMKNTGFLEEVPYREYSRDWHLHQNKSIVLESYLSGSKKFIKGLHFITMDGCDEYMRGDIFLISLVPSGIIHHSAVCLNEKSMIHCIQPRGVQISTITNWWKRHIKITARIMMEN